MNKTIPTKPLMISCNSGQFYKVLGNIYILSGFEMDGKQYAALINPTSGNRFADPIEVKNFTQINPSEFRSITDGEDYELVSK